VADTSSRRRTADRGADVDLQLEAELLPVAGQQQHAIHDALRLLAAWAVRAARDRALEADPNPSPRPGGAGQQHEATQEADQ
jgi:hypothetical protein